MSGEKVYLRLGSIPTLGRSRTGLRGRESGVSVFEAQRLEQGKYCVFVRTRDLADALVSAVKLNQRIYEVCGDVVGRGGAGEPTLVIQSKRHVRPPITIELEGNEERVEWFFDNFEKITRYAYGADRKNISSGVQQVVRLGSRTLGSAKQQDKKSKKARRKASRR